MKYSKATNYALHTMLHLAIAMPNQRVGVQELAQQLEVSPTYLSKILAKLVKTGMIESSSGANGGYKLRTDWEDISFLDIIHAIEGPASLFGSCLKNNPGCLIQKVMISAEERMEEELRNQKVSNLAKESTVVLKRSCFQRESWLLATLKVYDIYFYTSTDIK